MSADFWDNRYAADGYVYGTAPNAFLRAQAFRLRPDMRALALADGEGRNGVWLAEQGLEVVSVDQSAVGLEKARRLAETRGVRLATERADLLRWAWPRSGFDVVAAIYAHFPPDERHFVHARAAEALRQGGLLLLEAFHKAQLGRGTGGPKVTEMLYDADILRQDFAGLTILELTEGVILLDEGDGHRGEGAIVRLVARRD